MRVALLASLFTFAACDVGEVPIGGGGGADGGGGLDPMARMGFDSTIKALVDSKGCTTGGAAGACHGNVQPPIFTSFDTLTSNGANTTYIKKPSASNKLIVGPSTLVAATNLHQGVAYFDAAQKTMISAWIDMYGAP